MKRRIEQFIMSAAAVLLLAGCGSSEKPWDTLENCKQENTSLSMQVQDLQVKNKQLKTMLATSLELPAEVRLEAIDTLEKIHIAKRTGFYDKDNDGIKETLVIYLKPTDTVQDAIKAVGKVNAQLWDLDTGADESKLMEWTVEPDELYTAWGGNIFDAYYRIKLPMETIPQPDKEYTLKVQFTDYLGGKILTDQKVLSTQ